VATAALACDDDRNTVCTAIGCDGALTVEIQNAPRGRLPSRSRRPVLRGPFASPRARTAPVHQ